jgi:vacuolar-type H+-ATPase subunit H
MEQIMDSRRVGPPEVIVRHAASRIEEATSQKDRLPKDARNRLSELLDEAEQSYFAAAD